MKVTIKMKVMYFIHTLDIGGAETICAQYLMELKKRNIDVVLVVIAHRNNFLEDRLKRNGIRIISIYPLKYQSYPCAVLNGIYRRIVSFESWWNKMLDKEQPDVIHINTLLDCFSATNFSYNKLIYTFHGCVDRYMNMMSDNGRRKLKYYSKCGMKFFSLSSEMSEDIRMKLSSDNIVYMPNGLDIAGIRRRRYKRNDFLSGLGIDADSLVIGHVARFDLVKNQARTVGIFQEVLKRRPDSYLLFVGNIENEYGENVKKQVAEAGLDNRIRFLGIRDDATKIMSVLDAVVLPSITESFSLVMVEAQTHNIRAVASLAVPESVICNNNCFRLSLDDSDEKWAYYITGDFTEKHSYKLEDFAMDNVVDKLLAEYRKSAAL